MELSSELCLYMPIRIPENSPTSIQLATRVLCYLVACGAGLMISLFFLYGAASSEGRVAVFALALGVMTLYGALGVVYRRWIFSREQSLATFSVATLFVSVLAWRYAWLSNLDLGDPYNILLAFLAVPAVLGGVVLLDRYINPGYPVDAEKRPSTAWFDPSLYVSIVWKLLVIGVLLFRLGPNLFIDGLSPTELVYCLGVAAYAGGVVVCVWITTCTARVSLTGKWSDLKSPVPPRENAILAGVFVMLPACYLLIPLCFHYCASSRSAAIAAWGGMIALIWAAVRRGYADGLRCQSRAESAAIE